MHNILIFYNYIYYITVIYVSWKVCIWPTGKVCRQYVVYNKSERKGWYISYKGIIYLARYSIILKDDIYSHSAMIRTVSEDVFVTHYA